MTSIEEALRARAQARRIKEQYEGTFGFPQPRDPRQHQLLALCKEDVLQGMQSTPAYAKSAVPALGLWPPQPRPGSPDAVPVTARGMAGRKSSAAGSSPHAQPGAAAAFAFVHVHGSTRPSTANLDMGGERPPAESIKPAGASDKHLDASLFPWPSSPAPAAGGPRASSSAGASRASASASMLEERGAGQQRVSHPSSLEVNTSSNGSVYNAASATSPRLHPDDAAGLPHNPRLDAARPPTLALAAPKPGSATPSATAAQPTDAQQPAAASAAGSAHSEDTAAAAAAPAATAAVAAGTSATSRQGSVRSHSSAASTVGAAPAPDSPHGSAAAFSMRSTASARGGASGRSSGLTSPAGQQASQGRIGAAALGDDPFVSFAHSASGYDDGEFSAPSTPSADPDFGLDPAQRLQSVLMSQHMLDAGALSPEQWARVGLPQDDHSRFRARSYTLQPAWDAATNTVKRMARPDIFRVTKEEEARRAAEAEQAAEASQRRLRTTVHVLQAMAAAVRERGPQYDEFGVLQRKPPKAPAAPRYLDWAPSSWDPRHGAAGSAATATSRSAGAGAGAGGGSRPGSARSSSSSSAAVRRASSALGGPSVFKSSAWVRPMSALTISAHAVTDLGTGEAAGEGEGGQAARWSAAGESEASAGTTPASVCAEEEARVCGASSVPKRAWSFGVGGGSLRLPVPSHLPAAHMLGEPSEGASAAEGDDNAFWALGGSRRGSGAGEEPALAAGASAGRGGPGGVGALSGAAKEAPPRPEGMSEAAYQQKLRQQAKWQNAIVQVMTVQQRQRPSSPSQFYRTLPPKPRAVVGGGGGRTAADGAPLSTSRGAAAAPAQRPRSALRQPSTASGAHSARSAGTLTVRSAAGSAAAAVGAAIARSARPGSAAAAPASARLHFADPPVRPQSARPGPATTARPQSALKGSKLQRPGSATAERPSSAAAARNSSGGGGGSASGAAWGQDEPVAPVHPVWVETVPPDDADASQFVPRKFCVDGDLLGTMLSAYDGRMAGRPSSRQSKLVAEY